MNEIRVGVIGTGGMGERHARNIAGLVPGATIGALMDVDLDRAKALAGELGQVKVYDDAKALIAAQDIDAVVIASPDFTHAENAIECIRHRKPVLCEKPLATNSPLAMDIVETELDQGQRLLQLGFMREYDPAHRRVMALLGDGRCGRPIYFNGIHINQGNGKPRTIEDVITNSAVHDIHSARFMMPGEITRVNSSIIADSADNSCRLVSIALEYDDGAVGVIECDAQASYGYEVFVRIRCERGAVETLYSDDAVCSLAATQQSAIDEHLLEVKDWVASVQSGTPTGPSAWDGYRSLSIADRCVESAARKQPISVPVEQTPTIYRS